MKKKILKIVCAVLVFAVLATQLNFIFDYKDTSEWSTDRRISNYDILPKNSVDILAIGTSRVMAGVNTMLLYDKYGIAAYDYAARGETIPITYLHLEQALKNQHPKLVVFDISMICFPKDYYHFGFDEASARTSLDTIGFSFEKASLLFRVLPLQEIPSYLFPVLRYHNRYKELSKYDFDYFNMDNVAPTFMGYYPFERTENKVLPQVSNGVQQLDPYDNEYMVKIFNLCKAENIPLLCISMPNTYNQNPKKLNAFSELAAQYGVNFINYNKQYAQAGFDFGTDMRDQSHVNVQGSQKITENLWAYVQNAYHLQSNICDKNNKTYDQWTKALLQYHQQISAFSLQGETNINHYLDKLKDHNYLVIISAKDDATAGIKKSTLDKLNELSLNANLKDKIQWSYLAVIDQKKVLYERVQNGPLNYNKHIGNLHLSVMSQGANVGNFSSIMIDGVEYSRNSRGLNIVVYDKILNKVVDSVAFDTNFDLSAHR